MRKILSLLALVLMCVLIFCGCEKSDTNGAQSGAQTSTGGEPSVSESAAEVSDSEEQSTEQRQKEVLFKELNEEYARVLADKKQAYAEYRQIRDEMKKLTMAKHNVDEFLNRDESEIHRKRDRERHLSR